MKVVLLLDIFIVTTFGVRASEHWGPNRYNFRQYPTPQNQFRRSNSGSSSQSQNSHTSERMRRRPSQRHYFTHEDYEDERRHEDHHQYNSNKESYSTHYDNPKSDPEHVLYYYPERMYALQRSEIGQSVSQKPSHTKSSRSKSRLQNSRRPNRRQRRKGSSKFIRNRSDENGEDFAYPTENPHQYVSGPYYDNDTTYNSGEYVVPEPTKTVGPTTTQEPFDISDIKVPPAFLRIEYMISFSFLGLMYGLGFLVMFQTLCVTTAKITVTLVYYALLKAGVLEPYTIQDALEQIPPLK